MKYLVARFTITPNSEVARDVLAGLAGEAGFETFEETDEGLNGYAQEELLDEVLLRTQLADFPLADVHIEYQVEEAEYKDWNATWEDDGFAPIVIGDRCVIYDARRADGESVAHLASPDALRVGIEARMAFGTGTHETTQLMVTALMERDLSGKRVLDCGCGTGILAIVASLCGASEVVAYDIDEWSADNSRHNAKLNHADNIEVLQGDANVLSHVSGVFDVVVANINRNILLNDMHAFKDVMASDATLIVSGFYEEDVEQLVAKASELGLEYKEKNSQGDWRSLTFG